MQRIGFVTIIAVGMHALVFGDIVHAASTPRTGARLDTYTCATAADGTEGEHDNPIHTVSGTVVISNARSHLTLANLVIEVQAPQAGEYVPVARHVLNASGRVHSVETCKGTFADGPLDGTVVFVDGEGHELGFDQVKHLAAGTVAIKFVATFAGAIPGLDPGERARVKAYATAVGDGLPRPCSVDADGDGFKDAEAQTLTFQTNVSVPASLTIAR